MKRTILPVVFIALLMLSVSAGYLLLSENGLKWLLSATEDLFPGKLSASSFSGRIIGPVEIEGLRYRSDDFDLSVKRVFFDWRPLSLLFLRFHISALHADNAELRLSGEKQKTAAKKNAPFKLPMAVIVDDASVSDLSIRQPGPASPFIITKANLAAHASGESVYIDTFAIAAPVLDLEINGTVTLREDFPLEVKTRWTVRPEGYPDIAGKGSIDGPLKKLTVIQDTSGPFQASLQATVLNVLNGVQWEAALNIEDLRPAHIMPSLPDVKLSGQIRGEGDLDGLSFRLVHAKMLGGQLDGEGNVKWSMGPEWEISMRGRGLDPGEVWPDFPGKLDLSVNAVGEGREQGGQVALDLQGLKGQIRGYKVSASGTFLMSGDEYSVRRLEARSGSAYLNAKGTLSGESDFQWDFNAPDLGEIFPEASGNVKGRGTITGQRDAPRVKVSLSGGRVEVSGYRAGRLSADIDVELTETGNAYINLGAKNLLIASLNLTALNVKGEGTAASHRIRIDAGPDKVSAGMTLRGGLKKKTWSGMLAEARITSDMTGTWTLKKPGSLLISGDRIAGGSLCFADDGAEACMEGEWKKDSDSHGKIMLSNLPLTLAAPFLPAGLKPRGTVSGRADVSYSAERTIRGNIELVLSAGNIAYVTKGKEIAFAYGPGNLTAVLDQEALKADFAMPVQDGSLKGTATLPRFNPLGFDAENQELAGNISIERIRLNFLPVFIPDIQDAEGTASADINAAGTLASPQFTGSIAVGKGAASVATLGIHLADINFSAASDGTEHFIFQGSASSGGGSLHIEGRTFMGPQTGWPSEMRVTGEKFEFLNVPQARIITGPDVTVHTRKGRADVKGTVRIPEARLEPRDLSGAVRPSPDVVVVSSRDGAAAKEELKIYSSIKFSFGEKVFFSGFGLKGFISGDLTVVDDPVGLTLASGELRIRDGEYSAYGQTLKIEQGRLLFAGSPVDNPGLDIRVVRRVGEVTAGIDVQGTLSKPELTLFSTPSMNQEDILAYLLIGRPLSGATGSEGNFLYNAALKAGLKGGGIIASRIGARLGLDEVTIEAGTAAEESSLVLGKYLSPRLYVSYGIGLFQPTYVFRALYELSKRWSLRSEHGPESGADLFYRIEK